MNIRHRMEQEEKIWYNLDVRSKKHIGIHIVNNLTKRNGYLKGENYHEIDN